jgi:hypothetical protein
MQAKFRMKLEEDVWDSASIREIRYVETEYRQQVSEINMDGFRVSEVPGAYLSSQRMKKKNLAFQRYDTVVVTSDRKFIVHGVSDSAQVHYRIRSIAEVSSETLFSRFLSSPEVDRKKTIAGKLITLIGTHPDAYVEWEDRYYKLEIQTGKNKSIWQITGQPLSNQGRHSPWSERKFYLIHANDSFLVQPAYYIKKQKITAFAGWQILQENIQLLVMENAGRKVWVKEDIPEEWKLAFVSVAFAFWIEDQPK